MDNQLPAALARWLAKQGADAVHVLDLRLDDKGQLLWVRMGNCRTATLLARFESAWPGIQESFEAGHRIVMLP